MKDSITLYTGRRWPFLNPKPSDVHAADWHALAYIYRYNGSVGPYAVLEHEVRGVWLARSLGLPDHVCLAFAVHDNPEVAPPGDVPGPVIAYLKQHRDATGNEEPILAMREAAEIATYDHCGVLDVFHGEDAELVRQLDAAMLAAEKRDLLAGWADVPLPPWAPKQRIEPMPVERVLYEYHEILEAYAPHLAAEFREGQR